jgi:GDP-L-fucose synthase
MEQDAKIYVAGHGGLVGSALTRMLLLSGYENLVTRTSGEVDLRQQKAVRGFFQEARPEYVFLAAAKVGGIYANDTYPADFIYDNLSIQVNIIEAARAWGVKKLLFLGSSCIYPRGCPQPMKEEFLLTGELEQTNEAYAIAKIAGMKMCEAYRRQHGSRFISVMPTNLFGPGDNFDLLNSHVIPALMRRFHEGKMRGDSEVVVWGTGKPRREFLHVDDLADALVFLMKKYDEPGFINVGTGEDIAIGELAQMIKGVVGYPGDLRFDREKPGGTPRKLLDVSRIFSLGWKPRLNLRKGLSDTYRWFEKNYPDVRGV